MVIRITTINGEIWDFYRLDVGGDNNVIGYYHQGENFKTMKIPFNAFLGWKIEIIKEDNY